MIDKIKLIENLQKRGYEVISLATGAEAATWLEEHIQDTTIGIGGCWTAHQLELDKVLGKKNEVFWHWLPEHWKSTAARMPSAIRRPPPKSISARPMP